MVALGRLPNGWTRAYFVVVRDGLWPCRRIESWGRRFLVIVEEGEGLSDFFRDASLIVFAQV